MSSSKSILVVEDEKALTGAISRKLDNSGYKVFTARTADEAVGILEAEEGIALVWLDHYLLGNFTGLDFVAKMKSNEKWAGLPIFVVTSSGAYDNKQIYLSLGVNNYYVKSNQTLESIVQDVRDYMDKE